MPKFDYLTTSPAEQQTDLLVLPFFEGPEAGPGLKEVGKALGTDLVATLRDNGVKGKLGDTLTVPTMGRVPAGTALLVGLGLPAEAGPDKIRRATGKIAARADRYRKVATTLPQATKGSWEEGVQAFVEGLLLGSYRFERYKGDSSGDGDRSRLNSVSVLGPARWDKSSAQEAIRRGEIFAEATTWARDMVNTPAQDATPEFLAGEARKMAKDVGLQFKVWTAAELKKGGFGGILGVGQGSENPPRLIELKYQGGSGPPVALTGKGITFDSGGLSIKDAKDMEWMKADMAGAASVIAAMRAIAKLKPKVNVIAAIPSAENMPGGTAIRPGDVLRHRGGTTSEVLNTDAEGRLILADALSYLAEQKPRVIVDTATLTGSCMIALGEDIWGVLGNDEDLIKDVLAAGEEAGEPGWELPLWKSYRRHIESGIADVKNIGTRWGGAIHAALFLEKFVGDVPWAHMDIAGTAWAESPGDYWPKGATGSPARTFIRFVESQAAKKSRKTVRSKK
ncbi:MAG TPA: leucyl aminopeptidase [Actinomycetota bacterium]|nr:leucyl aminopeptidase [Actinomycetota bacterium]